jgi:hypothetical protein
MSFLLSRLWQITDFCNRVLFSDHRLCPFFSSHCLCHSFCHTCNKQQAYAILFFFSCRCLCPSLCHACDKKHASAILLSYQATVYLFHNYFEKLCDKKHFNCVQSFICILSVQWGLELPWNCLFSYCNSVYYPNWINKPGTIMITKITDDSIKNSTTTNLIFTFSVATYHTFLRSFVANFQSYMSGKWFP